MMNPTLSGVVVVSDLSQLAQCPTVFLLPSKLRLIRTALGDNGFRGVRTVTSMAQFAKDLQKEKEGVKQGVDYMPDFDGEGNLTDVDPGSEDSINTVFNSIEEGEWVGVRPGDSIKYLVCNPQHRWALALSDGVALLCPVSPEKAGKVLGKAKTQRVLETDFASFV